MVENNKDIAVVIPYYKNDLSESEQYSLRTTVNTLSKYVLFLICPCSLDTSAVCQVYPQLRVKRFEDSCFNSLRSYNKLMLSEFFYTAFSDYDYLLICQLDALVFKDELRQWVDKGYDYVGAPWIGLPKYTASDGATVRCKLKRCWYRLTNNTKRLHRCIWGEVGNGGFSLRKVEKMLQITRVYKEQIASQLDDNKRFYAEDIWLLYEPKGIYRLKKPSFREALGFAVETRPDAAFRWSGYELPFGCHAFNKEPYKDFWMSVADRSETKDYKTKLY